MKPAKRGNIAKEQYLEARAARLGALAFGKFRYG